ncbi:hypothetical protein [Nesterenkonia pannonica]|nr:hypothetical protein [Nesterenkonia pannonica]
MLIMAPEAAVDKITRSVGRLSRGIRFLEVTPSGPARALWPAT